MRLRPQTLLLARLLILAWTVLWIATVPLFHTHLPDISDRAISTGGIAHTVFSPDLPGEFFRFSAASQGPSTHLSNRHCTLLNLASSSRQKIPTIKRWETQVSQVFFAVCSQSGQFGNKR